MKSFIILTQFYSSSLYKKSLIQTVSLFLLQRKKNTGIVKPIKPKIATPIKMYDHGITSSSSPLYLRGRINGALECSRVVDLGVPLVLGLVVVVVGVVFVVDFVVGCGSKNGPLSH